jgi:hypothetical protein
VKINIERITHAAIKAIDDSVVLGKSHADCFEKSRELGIDISKKARDQGFQTNCREFVDREEAARIAFICDQIGCPVGVLFSEDLWSKSHGGKYDYDEQSGYVQGGEL